MTPAAAGTYDDGVLVDLVLGQNTRDTLAAGELERDLGRTLGGWLEVHANPFLNQRGERVWFVPGPVQAPGEGSILPEQVLALLADADTRISVRSEDPGSDDGSGQRRHTYRPGETVEANLQSLCPAHHGFKHHAGWTITMTEAGGCTWSAPDGRTHTTEPGSRRDLAA